MKTTLLAASAVILNLVALPAHVHAQRAAAPRETSTPVFDRELPNAPGKKIVAVEVLYPPGGASPAHTHAKSAFIYAYVLSGEIVSAVDDEKPRFYRAGEHWHENPGATHRVSRNASKTQPAKLLAIFILDPSERQLVFPQRE